MIRSGTAVLLSLFISAVFDAEMAKADSRNDCRGLLVSTVGAPGDAKRSSCLSVDQIEMLPPQQFETSTFWTDGVHRFEGVALADVLRHHNGAVTSIKLIAENDYEVVVPADAIGRHYPIIATRMDGEALDDNEMGPFWVVYPYDQEEEFRTSCAHARSVWMLSSIEAYQ